MAGIESLIEGSERLTAIFGYWPSFHDAEIVELRLWRGDVDPDRDSYVFPELTVRMYVWELAPSAESPGCLDRQKITQVTLRFHGVEHDFRLEGVSHENSINELSIERRERGSGPTPFFDVRFVPHAPSQLGASFKCLRIEVVEAAPIPTGRSR